MRTIRDVMSGDLEVLHTTETAADAACFLARRGEDSATLCQDDGSLAGTVSGGHRDAGRSPGPGSEEVRLAEFADFVEFAGAPDGRPTASAAIALDIDISLEDAVALMCRYQRSRLPVVDRARVVGFVTQHDAARARSASSRPGPTADGSDGPPDPEVSRPRETRNPETRNRKTPDQRDPSAALTAFARAVASSVVRTRRPYSAPTRSTTMAGPFPWTAAKSLPKPPRRVPTAITLGNPVPGARIPRNSGHGSSTARTARTRAVRARGRPVAGVARIRGPGTGLPNVIAVGTRRGGFGKDFAAVHGKGPAIVVDLVGRRVRAPRPHHRRRRGTGEGSQRAPGNPLIRGLSVPGFRVPGFPGLETSGSGGPSDPSAVGPGRGS